VVEALYVSRCIFQRMISFITYRIAATLQLLTFFFIAGGWVQRQAPACCL
jgi:H+-transporting ATPase